MNCPRCNYPQGPRTGDNYKGIYSPGAKCSGCGYQELSDLTAEQYAAVKQQLLVLAALVRDIPFEAFLLKVAQLEDAGPAIDREIREYSTLKKMVVALCDFKSAAPRVCPQCKTRTAAYAGAVYCGAACAQAAEAKVKPPLLSFMLTENQVKACPILSLRASHYNPDGSCKCEART